MSLHTHGIGSSFCFLSFIVSLYYCFLYSFLLLFFMYKTILVSSLIFVFCFPYLVLILQILFFTAAALPLISSCFCFSLLFKIFRIFFYWCVRTHIFVGEEECYSHVFMPWLIDICILIPWRIFTLYKLILFKNKVSSIGMVLNHR